MPKHVRPLNKEEQKRSLAEMRHALLSNRKIEEVIRKAVNIALDDEHQGQMQAQKLILDRILPVASFTTHAKGANQIQINISGIDSPSVEGKVIEHDDDGGDS